MDKKTKDLLESVRANPSSGISHDAKMAQVQVEAVFATDRLNESIEKLDKSTTKYSRILVFLTIVMILLAGTQLLVTLFLPETFHERIVFGIFIIGALFFLANRLERDFKDL